MTTTLDQQIEFVNQFAADHDRVISVIASLRRLQSIEARAALNQPAIQEGMAEDAKRYQWIRAASDESQEIFDKYAGEMLDAEIDKAMFAAAKGDK
jgi:hypothetical protein